MRRHLRRDARRHERDGARVTAREAQHRIPRQPTAEIESAADLTHGGRRVTVALLNCHVSNHVMVDRRVIVS